MTGTSQAQHIADTFKGTPANRDGTKVLVPNPDLVLTHEQEARLLDHLRIRRDAICNENGREDYRDDPGAGAHSAAQMNARSLNSFYGRRHLCHLIYNQQMDWRAWIMGGLYEHTNVHLPLTKHILQKQCARAIKSYFGTSPFFAVNGAGSAEDDSKSVDAQAWMHHETQRSGFASHVAAGLELTFVQGEQVMKTSNYRLSSIFETHREVAIDPSGQPYVTDGGDYIYKTDTFAEVIDEAGNVSTVLTRDGKTPRPPEPELTFRTEKLTLSQDIIDEVRTRPIYYLDFFAAMDAADLQTTDLCGQFYKAPIISLAHQLLQDAYAGSAPEDQIARIAHLASSLLAGANHDASSGVTAANRPRSEQGETLQVSGSNPEPLCDLVENWCWFDVFGDGMQRSLLVVTDATGNIPVYYNYVANVTDTGDRPLDVLRINPVPGRWYGTSNVEALWDLQNAADLIFNRALFAQSRAARVDFWQRDSILNAENLELNWGGTYELRPDKEVKDALQSVYLNDNKGPDLLQYLETVQQHVQSLGAVADVNSNAMAGLDSNKLATGIKNLEAAGEEMFGLWMFHLAPGMNAVLTRHATAVLKDALHERNKVRIRSFFDRSKSAMMEFNVDDLRDIDLTFEFELTTYKAQAQMTQAQMAYNMATAYWQARLGPFPLMAQRVKPLVEQFLRALEVRDAAGILAEPTPEEMAMMAAMMPPAAPGAPPLPGAPTPGLPTPTTMPPTAP